MTDPSPRELNLRLIVERAEMYLDADHRTAASLNQRASTFGAIFIATATAIAGALLSVTTPDTALTVAGLVVVAGWLLAAAACLYALWPIPFHAAGVRPGDWTDYLVDPHEDLLEHLATHYEDFIEVNAPALTRKARALRYAFLFALAAPVVAFAAFITV